MNMPFSGGLQCCCWNFSRSDFMVFSPQKGSLGIKPKSSSTDGKDFLCIFVEFPLDNHKTNLIKSDHLAGLSLLPVMFANIPSPIKPGNGFLSTSKGFGITLYVFDMIMTTTMMIITG